jgi:hypothetical protein
VEAARAVIRAAGDEEGEESDEDDGQWRGIFKF